MIVIYELILIFLFIFYIPVLVVKRKFHLGLFQRLGFINKFTKISLLSKRNIWVHAVSVGEVLAVSGLIKSLKDKFPQFNIVCTTVTKTGFNIAKETLKDSAFILYSPLDFSLSVNRYIRAINPVIYISAETEIWPNLYRYVNKKGVPILLINGRISDRTFKNYMRVKKFIRESLENVLSFSMQTELDAKRVRDLGAEEKRVVVLGNLKFDADISSEPIDKRTLGFSERDIVFVAGSTHPQEEEIIIEVYQRLKAIFNNVYL
ncbi:MAG: hypothetical protein HQL27_08185, partial [Candidatus Omnitrophica bacterium]|nr:hypothetical protein [Candidatus Omnitrophota bacterium]